MKERVGRRFAGDNVRRDLFRKLPEVPVETAFVAVREEMEFLRRWGNHLRVGTQIRMKRRRPAALGADDDEVWRRNQSVARTWDMQTFSDSSPNLGDPGRSAVRENAVDIDVPGTPSR